MKPLLNAILTIASHIKFKFTSHYKLCDKEALRKALAFQGVQVFGGGWGCGVPPPSTKFDPDNVKY